ncbi:hypothetical protein F5883DRAFT_721544 [Diaporthe sp. PMI_573]|nr:hypothetical protein F5883DRAFT_721544 [Diaporthaceae sp. PMI_573]
MDSVEFTNPKYFARDVVAFSDAELDQYLEEHRLDGGAMFVEVEDPENLPQSFIQRLRDRAQHTSDADQSRPVDPSQLTSRLLDISSGRNTSPQPPPPPFDRESSAATSSRIPTEEFERRNYNDLVEAGGRPLYSIDLIDEVAKDPFSHWNMLRPWVDHYADFEPDPDPNADLYSFRRRSPTYTEAVKELLAEYGFTRPFQFHEDPTHQDKLTTWIDRAKRMQPKYDAAWKTLVDANVLRPFETEEYVCNLESSVQRQSEEDQATRAVTLAKSAANAVLTSVFSDINHPRGPRLTSATRLRMMHEAKSRCETAVEALALIKRRNDLATEFKQSVGNYLLSKRKAEQHIIRVRWALEQVSLIVVELNESSMAKISPESVRGVKRSLERDEDNNASHDRLIKKQRRDAGALGPRSSLSGGPGDQRAKPKRSRDDAADDGPPSKRLERDGDDLDSTLGRNDLPDYQKAHLKRNCGDADDDRPPSKRPKRRGEDLGHHNRTRAKPKRSRDDAADDGPPSKRLRRRGEDLKLQSKTRDGINSGSARDLHEPDAARTMASLNSKRSEPVSNHPQRRTSTRSAVQPPPTPQPLRRSARIAARHLSNTVKNMPQSSRRSMAPAPVSPLHMGLGDQQSRHPAIKARMQSARVSERHGKPGRENSRGTSTRPPLG